jgi:hypothetical protein
MRGCVEGAIVFRVLFLRSRGVVVVLFVVQ